MHLHWLIGVSMPPKTCAAGHATSATLEDTSVKHLRATTLFAAVSALALVVPAVVLHLGSEAASSAEPAPPSAAVSEPPLSLVAAGKATAQTFTFDGRKVTMVDFGLYLRANGEPFELWAKRASYHDPIRVQWRSSRGAVTLPSDVMPDFAGLRDFLQIEITDAGGKTVAGFDGLVVRGQQLRGQLCRSGWSRTRRARRRTRSAAPPIPTPWARSKASRAAGR